MGATIYAKHEPYPTGHLGDVVADMAVRGSPTLRAMNVNGRICATEGSHRLAAAFHLGIVPKMVLEVQDIADCRMNGHWDSVTKTLPAYYFKTVLVLDLSKFGQSETA